MTTEKEYIVELQAFIVRARNNKEAHKIATERLKSGEEAIHIAQVLEE